MPVDLATELGPVGRTCEVLVERKGKLPGQWLGKTPWLQSAWFEGDVQIETGIRDAHLIDCEIGDEVLISRSGGHIARMKIEAGARITDVGTIATGPGAVFGNGVEAETINEGIVQRPAVAVPAAPLLPLAVRWKLPTGRRSVTWGW